MRKSIITTILYAIATIAFAQMPSDGNPSHTIKLYADRQEANAPAITVYLPEASKANGTACIICPGGAMVSLSWDGEFLPLAKWLNERGIAAIGLQYTLRDRNATQSMPRGNMLRATITEVDKIKKANANPVQGDNSDPTIQKAINDALLAMTTIKAHANEWNISKDKIGYIGFSAGGGVAVGATVKANAEQMPAFLCSVYGPSLIDVDVPQNAPPLFIAVHADHPNVAAGCLALFNEWKKAGKDAELHVYGNHTGGLYGGNQMQDYNTPNGSWQEQFYSWLMINSATTEISSGKIAGSVHDGIYSFKGIPYAKAERFMPSEPVDKWEGVRDCTKFGPWAKQQENRGVSSEDGNFLLNVWTKGLGDNKKRPVMIWIHGGGYSTGSATANRTTFGEELAKKDVVLISINHRLDIMGFLDLSSFGGKYKQTGNVGMLDIVEALKWVKANAEAFGGDPNNVTVFGESGGGGKVGTLLCMPSAKGLFHKAIIESGAKVNIMTKKLSQQLGKATVEELGLDAKSLDKLQTIDYNLLMQAGLKCMDRLMGKRTPGSIKMWGFTPNLDGKTVLELPYDPGFADIMPDVPIIMGSTFNELDPSFYRRTDMTMDDAMQILKQKYGEDSDAYVAAFKKANPDCSIQDMLSIDSNIRGLSVRAADARLKNAKAPIYMYLFNWHAPNDPRGSYHGLEIPFVFNTTRVDDQGTIAPDDQNAITLGDKMSDTWVNFAKTGKPYSDKLPEWEAYDKERGAVMIFDNKCEMRYDFDRELQNILLKHLK